MASIVLFHSALGRRPSIEDLAGALRAAGHEVWTPDLYGGRVLDNLDEGVAERDRIGIPELIGRAHAAVAGMPGGLVFAGISLGTGPAQLLATTLPGARGAVLIQGAVPLAMLELDRWPEGLPLQMHVSPEDPWHEQPAVDELVAAVPASLLEVHTYPDTQHLFMDRELAEYDAVASDRLVANMLGWLADR